MLPILLLAALCGCGGGGEGGSTPAPSSTPSPAAPGAGEDPAAAGAAAVAARREAIRDEIAALRGLSDRRVRLLFWQLDGLALRLGSAHFKADTRRLEAFNRRLEKPAPFGGGYAGFQQRIERRQWATLVPVWERYARRLERAEIRGGPIARSARDFQLAEWRRSLAMMREFLAYLRREGPRSTHEGYYQERTLNQASRWPVVIAVPQRKRKLLVRGLERDLRRLQGADELGPDSPSVGDAYRRAIRASFVSPLREALRREAIVAGQQWMLFRLAELEDTPAAAYEAARSTLALQGLSDARNPYTALRDIGLELHDQTIIDLQDLHRVQRLRRWAVKLLARPVPPLLEPTRDRMLRLFERLDLRLPPQRHPLAIFDLSDDFDRDAKPIVRILRRGAKLVDDPRALRRAIRAELEATRPAP